MHGANMKIDTRRFVESVCVCVFVCVFVCVCVCVCAWTLVLTLEMCVGWIKCRDIFDDSLKILHCGLEWLF
jgi:hypothetical protein